MDIRLGDFQPVNYWKPDEEGACWGCSVTSMFVIDNATGRKYLNEGRELVAMKCFLLSLGTPFVHGIASVVNVVYRILKVAKQVLFSLKNRDINSVLSEIGLDLLRVMATPFAFIGLELSAIYGVFSPYDGRKLYATIERAVYGDFILAPCFQPEPEQHLFGGDMGDKGSW